MNILYLVKYNDTDDTFALSRQVDNNIPEQVGIYYNLIGAFYSAEKTSYLLDKCEYNITLKVDVEMQMCKSHTH